MKRLDILLIEQGLAPSREKAKELIKNAQVQVDGQTVTKPASPTGETARIAITGPVNPYVSRGGLKLEKALTFFGLDMTRRWCIDIGASTGGFTDCLLQHGAQHVTAIDVGKDQLVPSLRTDPRVTSLEETNIRALLPGDLPRKADFICIDVSFISLTKVLPVAVSLLAPDALGIVALVKPQFEAGKAALNKKGIVKDPKVHERVLTEVIQEASSLGLSPKGLTYSPLRGPEGNIEFLLYLQGSESSEALPFSVSQVVKEAHRTLL